jgi:ribosomal protein L37AE/L43A
MEAEIAPHRCPQCHALVVDRRSAVCTTCRAELPKEWVMTPEQAEKTKAIDREIQAEHKASLNTLDPANDPNVPRVVRLLDTTWGM